MTFFGKSTESRRIYIASSPLLYRLLLIACKSARFTRRLSNQFVRGTMIPAHYSPLLPAPFRHNSPQVRVSQPQVILLDFHGTISERRWEDKVVYPYVKSALASYVRENLRNEVIQKHLPGLKNESFEQRFRNKYEDAPIIEDSEDVEEISLADQISDFLIWQLNNKKETKDTKAIERLVWQDGFRRHRIFTPVFDDVLPSIKRWREQFKCFVYILSSIDSDTLTLLFENTDKGNLNQYIKGYLGSKKIGEKLMIETYAKFYEQSAGSFRPPKTKNSPRANQLKSPPSNGCIKSVSSTKSLSPQSMLSYTASRPVLFLTDSGQEAKAASQVADGTAFECILVNRPGNKKIRTYYLSQFQFIDRFDEIEFV